jgi:putative endonuclease
MGATGAVGRYGERVAAAHLAAQGMQLLATNWRCLVVCEVKTRRGSGCGGPLEAVTPVKLGRLRRLAAAWLAQQDRHFAEVRIDVIGVHRPARGPAVVDHLRGVS